MTTESRSITVSGISVQIERKDIKNLHLGVYPPNGRVRVAAPLVVSEDAIRLAVIGKLAWIRRQKTRFAEQPRQSAREMVNGESHYFLGRRYRLRVHEQPGKQYVAIRGMASLDLFVNAGCSTEQREAVLLRWYRQQLNELLPPLLEQWQAKLGVQVSAWGIKRMKTKWGGCNPATGRIWFNLELAKKPARCLEYIVVHELIHLLERHHNEQFMALLNSQLPKWHEQRDMLNGLPLAHESWC
ncbi:M48 family metallopeptidase [Malikia spinosa]|uniref:M48 family metallopeptidase n=1 Tax=Malikia spinosa TaxID=86180 RepID=A0A7C9IWQ2_9BURK|nr:SprT family zinc-dependent metalloprotease [Malikia spinosa]MYZ51272.1 M48 family metallopeptidase [Malikia spinosa]